MRLNGHALLAGQPVDAGQTAVKAVEGGVDDLHRAATRLQDRLHALLGLPAPRPLPTSFTLGIDEPEVMARQAADLVGRSVIKLKLGAADGRDADRVAAVRAARPDATLYVDANAGWSPEAAVGHIEALAALGVALIEQPVAKHDTEGVGRNPEHLVAC